MVFVGDIAIPEGYKPNIDLYVTKFNKQIVIANLEGAITKSNMISTNDLKIFNSENVIDVLKGMNVKVVSLANNHITDAPFAFDNTKDALRRADILYCGAGTTKKEAAEPAVITDNGITYVFLGFGWNAIDCNYVRNGVLGVNPLTKENVINCVQNSKKSYPNAVIILLFHWDYELEIYPQPMHRELARIAIDVGANAIIGHHPHCIQGIEFYKDSPIVYSLGNCLFPNNIFFKGSLCFPEISRKQLAFELSSRNIICHIFEYSKSNKLVYVNSSIPSKCPSIISLTTFNNMNHIAYKKWFVKNRRKRKALPIFCDISSKNLNYIKFIWVKFRQRCVSMLFKMNLKSGPK